MMLMSSGFDMDQMYQYFITLTTNQIKQAFSSEESKEILSSFMKKLHELFEKLKVKRDEIEIFHGMNPVFVISLEESLPVKEKEIVLEHMLAIYKMMLEDFVLEPQRRFMASSKDPWKTFVEDTRNGNQKIYDNEYFKLKEVTSSSDEFSFDLHRCIYQEFFKEFGREDLGPLMCEYDSIVARNVAEWVKFERPLTKAEGYPSCTFRFYPIKQRFSSNDVIDSIYNFLKIIDESEEMISKQEIEEQGFEGDLELEDILKLMERIRNHSGVKTSIINDEIMFGNVLSYERYEEWKLLLNRRTPMEERSQIFRKLPLQLKDEKINELISQILDNPYENAAIKWLCLNYLQHHFSAKVEFESEGIDEFQLRSILDEISRNYSNINFQTQTLSTNFGDDTRVSIQVYGKGVPEYKLIEPAQLLRRKLVRNFPDAGLSRIKPIMSVDKVAQKFFDIFTDSKQPFQLRELTLRILISQVGNKLVPFLTKVAENKNDDPFLRGRAIDSLAECTSDLPRIFQGTNEVKDFENFPIPVQRSVTDFIARYGSNQNLLIGIVENENIATVIRRIATRNLGSYIKPEVTNFLIKIAKDKTQSEPLRQAALTALSHHELKSEINAEILNILIDSTESSFIRLEALETLKDLEFTITKDLQLADPDWITTLSMKQLMEG